MFLLDELKQQKGVSCKKYTRLNNPLSESLDADGEEEMGEDDGNEREMVVYDDNDGEVDELMKIINYTLDYVTQSDKKELTELLKELKEDYLIMLINPKELIGKFLTDEFEEGKLILPLINELITILPTTSSSPISWSKQHRLKMLIDGISKNRYRIESIFRLLDEAKDDELSILKGLVQGLLSDKQFEKLVELDMSDLPAVALVIKDTKVGQGVKFLPNTMKSLRKSLGTLLKELIDTGNAVIKTQVIPLLEELH